MYNTSIKLSTNDIEQFMWPFSLHYISKNAPTFKRYSSRIDFDDICRNIQVCIFQFSCRFAGC